MSNINITKTDDFDFRQRFVIEMTDEQEEILSRASVNLINTAFGGGFIKALTFSAVATPLHNRRKGYVREIFDKAWELGIEQGAVVSLLHPFSFSYYEKFGYGKVADHKIVRLPIRLLDTVPRCCDFRKFQDSETEWDELYAVHNEFCKNKQLMILQGDPAFFKLKDKEVWLYRENGKVTGYIAITTSKRLEINHYEDGVLTVHNIVYTTPAALKAVLGFIRMFEGELDDVEFTNIAMCPEIELYLHHDTHTKYRLLPDLMVRVLDSEKLLSAFDYPKQAGSFSIEVIDKLPTVNGKFAVKYGNGACKVGRLEESAVTDITVNASTFARLVYGYDGLTSETARFFEGITINGNADDFFRAFKKRPSGIFEHF